MSRFYVRIPHQMPVTVGTLSKGERRPDFQNHDADNWVFWYDSHATHAFRSKLEMKRWADNYSGHQYAQVRSKVNDFVETFRKGY